MESDLEDDTDELNAEFVFEKEDSEKDDVSDDQPKNILIPELNIHIIQDRWENPEDSEEKRQEDRVLSVKQKKNLKDSQQKRRKGRERKKEREKRTLRRLKFP